MKAEKNATVGGFSSQNTVSQIVICFPVFMFALWSKWYPANFCSVLIQWHSVLG